VTFSVTNFAHPVTFLNIIVNLEEKQKENPMNDEDLTEFIGKTFLTKSGRKEAGNVFGQ